MQVAINGDDASEPGTLPGVKFQPLGSILVVEDDLGLSSFIARTLRVAGYATEEVSTVTEARHAFETTSARLLLTDFSLPDGFGSDLASEFHALFPYSPIILTTGFPLDEVGVPGFRNATVVLPKPFDLLTLLETVRTALDGPPVVPPKS